jgi:hypothetical protein
MLPEDAVAAALFNQQREIEELIVALEKLDLAGPAFELGSTIAPSTSSTRASTGHRGPEPIAELIHRAQDAVHRTT